MQNVKNTMIDTVLAVVAPHLCCGCGKAGSLLCPSCKSNIMERSFGGCVWCGREGKHEHRPPFDELWVVGERKGVLQQLIGGFKFRNMKAAAEPLADLLDASLPPMKVIVIPVPTATEHIRERGYDHMKLIAQYFAFKRRLYVRTDIVVRAHSKTQHHATRQQRLQQAASAFVVQGSVDPNVDYLILDDVLTTGSTILQMTTVLKQAGARSVRVAVLARQPLD